MNQVVSILDVAMAMGAKEVDGAVNGAEFERLGLPLFCGCEVCGAQLSPFSAYPTTSGYICCNDHSDLTGFVSTDIAITFMFKEMEGEPFIDSANEDTRRFATPQ